MISFVTYFVRPRRLRFDWRRSEDEDRQSTGTETVWCNGTKGFWRHSDGKTDEIDGFSSSIFSDSGKSLGAAMGADIGLFEAMCTGASECGGVVWKVGMILVDEKISKGKNVLSMKDVEVLAEERVGQHLCYVLQGTVFRAHDHTVWICQSDFTIRRVKEESTALGKDAGLFFEQMREQKLFSEKYFEEEGMDLEEILSQAAMSVDDSHHLHEITYDDVTFDQEIGAEIFTAPIGNER
jgi:hypothetical protein